MQKTGHGVVIPAFLRSLAALARQLIAQGKAVHVTEETAQELELLAGLPWESATYPASAQVPDVERVTWQEAVKPADVALGWLLSSRLNIHTLAQGGASVAELGQAVDRSVVCAELVALAIKCETTNGGQCDADPREGTREGARAAWEFVVDTLVFCGGAPYVVYDSALQNPVETIMAEREQYKEIAATYRRELEAMR